MSTSINPPGAVGFPLREWTHIEPGARDLAGDFVAHLATVFVLDYPEDIRELVNAGRVLDEMLLRVPLYNYDRVKDYFNRPLLDIFELAECVGLDGIEEILAWSLSTLEGGTLEPEPSTSLVKIFGGCVGWNSEPSDPLDLASLVFLSTIAVYNKTLNNTGE
ncbi:MAG: hypothetical protein F7B60_06125 [Desulfurococcales archaeon]|nr:hypothetical protein [Desulfurococcales archaeon]